MSFSNDISEQYLDKLYDDLQREQASLLTSLKNQSLEDSNKEKHTTRLISLLNTMTLNVMKVKALKKKIAET